MSIMSQPRQFQTYNDTTFTKIFVGGLAWETQRDTMRRYFEQFGEILEAVVITDKHTGRSKGYGFVTFKDPEAAMRACQNPSPVIDGRRANCNLASLGANKNRPPPPLFGAPRFRGSPAVVASPAYHGSSSAIFRQPTGQYTFPYSPYGYPGYAQESMYPMNYYGVYGGQQFSPYYPSTGASGPAGLINSIYPFYGHYAQSSQSHGFGVQYPQMVQFPFLQHHHQQQQQHYGSASPGILSFPSSMPMPSSGEGGVAATIAAETQPATGGTGASQASVVKTSEQSSSS